MQVSVKLVGPMAEIITSEVYRFPLPEGSTARQVAEQLVKLRVPIQSGEWNKTCQMLLEFYMVSINGSLKEWDYPVSDGDKLVIFLPVSGG
ncbi:MAG: MoaD/ThiS family protein [Eubacteriales bacterium]